MATAATRGLKLLRYKAGAAVAKSYSPHEPTGKQATFLALDIKEAFYGGAAGGGKSDALLMAALQYVHVPGYRALILRRTFAALSLPDAILDRAKTWLAGTDASWNEKDKTFTFPSGATLTFGFLETENDKYRYQGAAFQFIGFDELTQFTESQYRYLFSRLRRLVGAGVPLRMRSASNPGGEGHIWVKTRFVLDKTGKRIFVPAGLVDNPHLDAESYIESLDELDPVEREQLLNGSWDVLPQGPLFAKEYFNHIERAPPLMLWVRYFDLATSTKQKADHTAGALLGVRANGTIVIADVAKWKREWPDTRDGVRDELGRMLEPGIVEIAKRDLAMLKQLSGEDVRYLVGVEAQGMQLALVQDLQRNDQFLRIPLHAIPAKGDKKQRASVWAARAKAGKLEIVEGAWNSDFENECIPFDGLGKLPDDQVDAVSGGVELLYIHRGGEHEQAKTITAGTPEYYEALRAAAGDSDDADYDDFD